MGGATSAANDRLEAARYALLRRLASSMRHHLVVNLQPIGMVYEVMDRRLRGPQPDLAGIQASAQKINGFAKAALASCLDVVTWLAPEDGAVAAPVEGVRECIGLLATGLAFRGYAVRNEVALAGGQVRRAAMRHVLTAALLQCTDETPAPAELVLSAQADAGRLAVRIALHSCDGEPGSAVAPNYRLIGWNDVQALALSEGVELERPGPGELVLAFPWVAAPSS